MENSSIDLAKLNFFFKKDLKTSVLYLESYNFLYILYFEK
ncbi:hypothetical protein ZPR_2579 [Zunongwangia profunda SM-A87]|uniref:Uncharacterized protein n=1 Tax=Zunongwangia profunda (strain DSM 18752 / CCTCC AB 206139 / SM-A87) TaxID=655815 RepID=D5BEE4_ZUNPS|nr:hypothetical protein ZPR_2579 [Zunongwangia profunda SM-A87]